MATTGPVRVLVVEDDRAARESLATALRRECFDVQEAGDGLSALAAARDGRPHLAVIDIGLPPGPDGLAVARRLRADRDLGVIFLTAAEALADRMAGFEAGADDYVAKPYQVAELLARVRALARRLGVYAPTLDVGELSIDEDGQTVTWSGQTVPLSPTETAVLHALVRHRRQVLSKARLLTLVWGHGQADPNLVEVTLGRLRRKLLAVGADVIRTVHGRGYTFEPQ